jgi:hypothetical protein
VVGAIGFEPTLPQPLQTLAGLGWQPKDRNGSERNNYWTRIGHWRALFAVLLFALFTEVIRAQVPVSSPSSQGHTLIFANPAQTQTLT